MKKSESIVENDSFTDEIGNLPEVDYDDMIYSLNYGEGLTQNNINCIRVYLKERKYDEVLNFLYSIEAENRFDDREYFNRFVVAARAAKKYNLDDVYPSFPSKYILCVKDSLNGLVDEEANLILELKYNDIDPLFSDFLIVQENELYGFLFPHNSKLIEPQFDGVYPDFDPLVLVIKDSLNGLMNMSGDLVQEVKYDVIWPPSDGMLKAKYNDKWGYIDTSGVVRIPFIYDYSDRFENGEAYVVDGQKRLIISKDNKIIREMND